MRLLAIQLLESLASEEAKLKPVDPIAGDMVIGMLAVVNEIVPLHPLIGDLIVRMASSVERIEWSHCICSPATC